MTFFLQLLLNGVIIGAVYALISLGYALTFTLNINNFSHGSIVMLGGYLTFIFLKHLNIPILFLFPLIVVCGIIIGALIYFAGIKPFNKNNNGNAVIATTLAISIIIDSIIFIFNGPDFFSTRQFIKSPQIYYINTLAVSDIQVLLIVCSIIIVIVLFFIVKRTNSGLKLRALADDPDAYRALGYSVNRTNLFAMIIAGVLGTVAGFLISFDYDFDSTVGIGFLTKAYTATIIGGAYNLKRVVIAAYFIGILENLVGGYWSFKYMFASTFVLLILFLLFRKEGFGQLRLKREV